MRSFWRLSNQDVQKITRSRGSTREKNDSYVGYPLFRLVRERKRAFG